jgi:hypothetical protein
MSAARLDELMRLFEAKQRIPHRALRGPARPD